ncbi:MAG: gas vesicle protein [Chloroflexota bacterium]
MEWRGQGAGPPAGITLLDILDKVLDKGLVVAGDIRVSLANVELLTIKVRLLVCSIDKAEAIGLDWWRRDAFLSSAAEQETRALLARVEALERRLTAAEQGAPPRAESEPGEREEQGGSDGG